MLSDGEIDKIAAEVAAQTLPHGTVLTVSSQPAFGADGEDMLEVLYVVRAAALDEVTGRRAINALSQLQDRLQEAGETRFASIHYATDAEINGGS